MVHYFCPACWKEVESQTRICPYCGADEAKLDSRPYADKLRGALQHPEPETAARVAWILGERREAAAVPDLIHLLEASRDGSLAEVATDARGKIGDVLALAALERTTKCGPLHVHNASRTAVERIRATVANHPVRQADAVSESRMVRVPPTARKPDTKQSRPNVIDRAGL